MSNFLDVDGPLYRFMSRLWDMMKLNALWLIFSGILPKYIIEYFMLYVGLNQYTLLSWIPVILIGPATTAVFYVTLRMVDEKEGYMAEPFMKAYRENFKQSLVLGIIGIVAVYAIWLDFQFYHAAQKLHESGVVYLVFGVIAIYFAFMHLVFAFALQSRYENTIINTLRNSYSIAAKFFIKTIFMFLVLAVLFGFFSWNNTTVFLGILIGPGCMMLTISGFAMQNFRLIENENREREEGSQEEQE